MRPWLSLLTPSFNGARYLRAAFESVLPQRDPGIEWVFVDGGSSDATLDLVEEYRSRLDLQVHVRPELATWPEKVNFALARATADHVGMLHTDDVWLPGRAVRVRRLVEAAPDATLLLHPSLIVDEHGRPLACWRCPLPAFPARVEPALLVERLLVQNFVAAPAATLRRSVAQEVGGLDPRLWYTADWDLYLKVAARGTAVYDPEPLAGYRVHLAASTVSGSADAGGFRDQLDRVLEAHLGRLGDPAARQRVEGVARASVAVNVALAAASHGRRGLLGPALAALLRLGPAGWRRYFRDSRLHERLVARLRHRLRRRLGR